MDQSKGGQAMSDTPRTEAEVNRQKCWSDDLITIDANFACQLERELNAANAEVERLRKANLQLREGAEEQKQRIHRLEDAGDALKAAGYFGGWADAVNKWVKVKEAKP